MLRGGHRGVDVNLVNLEHGNGLGDLHERRVFLDELARLGGEQAFVVSRLVAVGPAQADTDPATASATGAVLRGLFASHPLDDGHST